MFFATNDELVAQRAWKPFFAAFRGAVKKRDRETLRSMMSSDFFSSGGNSDGAEAAFSILDDPDVRGWEAFDKVLGHGTVAMAAWWNAGRKPKYVGRVAPPDANIRRNVIHESVHWYAILNFAMAVGTAQCLISVAIDPA